MRKLIYAASGTYTSGVGGAPTTIVQCQGHTYQCGDLVDNDNDGLIDYQDPDCLGPPRTITASPAAATRRRNRPRAMTRPAPPTW